MKLALNLAIIFFVIQSNLAQDTLKIPPIAENSTNAEIEVVLDSIEQKMRSLYLSKDYVKVLAYGDRGFMLADKVNNNKKFFTFSTFYGTSLLLMNDTIRAKKIFSKSYEKAKELRDTIGLMRSITNFGNFNTNYENFEKALAYYKEGIALSNGENLSQLFTMRINSVYVLSKLSGNRKDEMLEQLDAMEKMRDKIVKKSLVSAFHLAKSKFLTNYGNKDEAITSFGKTIKFAEESNHLGVIDEAYTLLLELLEEKGDYKAAYYRRKGLDKYRDQKFNLEKEKEIKEVITKMNVEQYKQELKAKELESQLQQQNAEKSKTILFVLVGATLVLCILLMLVYNLYSNRKSLVLNLQEKNKQYLLAKKETENLSKVKNDFLSAVTHELRTPLYGIIGISSILQKDIKLGDYKEDLESLKFSADYLLSLINDVLYLNKLEDFEKKKLEHKPFAIRELISKIVNSFEFMRAKNSNNFNVSIDPDVPKYLKGDYTKLSQILINLISNSCKFTEEGTISIVVWASLVTENSANIHFCIVDDGIGISKEKQSIIFNEFAQDSSTSSFAGTGLGLTIVKRLLDLHKATMSLKSTKNVGTEFSFAISYDIAQDIEFIIVEEKEKVDKSLEGSHILIVDDNKINRLVTRKVLELNNYTCTEAENGKIAVKKSREEIFDLILMDLNMPVMGGCEAVKTIRKSNFRTPIVALTAQDPTQLEEDLFQIGFNDIIIKPYNNQDFLDKVKSNFLSTLQI